MSEHSKRNSEKIIKTLDLPQDLFLGTPNISMISNQEISISNHRGILSYSPDLISIQTKEYQIQLKGKDLSIYNYSKEELILHGYIFSVEFL